MYDFTWLDSDWTEEMKQGFTKVIAIFMRGMNESSSPDSESLTDRDIMESET